MSHAAQTISYTDGQTDSTNYGTGGANNPTTLSITSGSAIQSGILSGAGAVIKAGSGTLTLTAANTYAGTTTINEGILKIQNATALGTIAAGTSVSGGTTLLLDGGITVTGEALTLNGQGGTSNGALRSENGNNEWTGAVTLASNSRINSSAGSTLALSGGITATNRNLRIGGGGNTVISGLSLGTGSLTKGGAGEATLIGTISYSGGTTISLGTLQIGNGGTSGSITGDILNNSTLIFNRSDNLAYNGGITGTGTLEKLGAGRLTLTSSNNFSGGTTITEGILRIGNGGTSGSITGDILNNATLIFNRSDNLAYDGGITGTGKLEKIGAGRLTLTGANDFSGGTTIKEGTLRIGNGGTTGSLTGDIKNNSALSFNRSDDLIFPNLVSGTGSLTMHGDGTVTLTGANTYAGLTTISTGTLIIQNASALGTNAAGTEVTSGAALRLEGGITITGEALTINGQGISNTGALLSQTGNNTWTGSITLGSNSRIQTVTDSSLVLSGDITSTNLNLRVAGGGNTQIDGVIALGTGSLTKQGPASTLTLTAANTYTGGTTITAGTLQIGNGGTTGSVVGNITNNAALIFNRSNDLTYTGVISGTGGVKKQGTGTLSLTGASSYGGGTTVESGGLLIADDAALGSEVLTLEDGVLFGTVTGENVAIANNVIINGDIKIQADVYLGIDGNTDLGSEIRTLTFTEDAGSICFEGSILGDGTAGLTLVAGAGVDSHEVLMCSLTGNTYGGLTNVGDGILLGLAGLGTLINGDLVIQSKGVVEVGSDDALGSNGTVTVDGVLDLFAAENQTINELLGSGAVLGGFLGTTLTVNAGEFDGVLDDGSGSLRLVKASTGTLNLTGANSYTGGTVLNSGTLQTQNAAALGTGQMEINGGTLAPVKTLNLTALTWNGGKITLTIGSTANSVDVNGDLTLPAPGKFTFLEGINFQPNKSYLILAADNLDTFAATHFSGSLLYGLKPKFSVINDQLFVSFNGTPTASGPLLQNTAGTPTFANFIVNGRVTTGTPNQSNLIEALTFNPGSSLRIFNNLTVTSGTFNVGSGRAAVFGGTVVTPGDFNKNGGGTLDVWSNFGVGGAANLNGGSLYVNGRFAAANGFNVAANTRLNGNGLIAANLINNGTLAPGNSPGTLTIEGNFTQTQNGTLQIEIASLNVFDRLIVSGNAALGGTLQAIPFDGFELEYGQQFSFLSAGSVSGQFDSVTMPENFRGRILVNGGNVTLLAAPSSYTLVAETQNQQNVAAALNAYIPATRGDRLTVSTALDLLTAAQYPAAFDQISPAFYQTLTGTVIEQYNAQGQFLQQRFSSVALGRQAGFATYGFNAPAFTEKTLDPKNPKSPIENSQSKKWGLWVQGNGIFSRNTSVQNLPSYRSESGGFLVGGDYRWSETFVTGVFGGYQGAVSRYGDSGRTTINAVRFGTYATYDAGNGFYANTVIGGGYSAYDVKRSIQFGNVNRNANSAPGGAEFTSQLAAGYDWKIGGLTIGPIASAQYTYAGIGGFTENGADSLNLAVGQQNANSLRTSLGARAAYLIPISKNFALIPEVRLSWQHEFLMNPTGMSAALDGGNGPGFGYTTSAPARDAVFAGAGVTLQLGERWNANVYYNSSFGRQDFTSQMISSSLGFNF